MEKDHCLFLFSPSTLVYSQWRNRLSQTHPLSLCYFFLFILQIANSSFPSLLLCLFVLILDFSIHVMCSDCTLYLSACILTPAMYYDKAPWSTLIKHNPTPIIHTWILSCSTTAHVTAQTQDPIHPLSSFSITSNASGISSLNKKDILGILLHAGLSKLRY